MIQLHAELQSIDYAKLLYKIQEPDKKGVPHWVIKLLGELLTSSVSGIAKILIPKGKIRDFAAEYGLSFSKLEVKGINLVKKITEADNMLYISAFIKKVDWNIFAGILSGTAKNQREQDNTHISEAFEIIKPFINDTMATVPSSAIVAMINLFGQDEVIRYAGDCGVIISSLSITPGK